MFDSTTTPLDVSHWRVTGVLQRIGVCYLLGALLTLRTNVRQQIWIAAVLLIGYWLALTLIPVPGHGMGALLLADPGASLASYVDRAIIGPHHMWIGGGGIWDPEGILSSIPATGTVILGVIGGQWLASPKPLAERLNGLFARGLDRHDGGARVGLVVSDREESLDELLRDLHGRHGLRRDRSVRLAGGRARLARVDQTLHPVRDESDRRLRGLGLLLALHLHVGEGAAKWRAGTGAGGVLRLGARAAVRGPRDASLLFALIYVLVFYAVLRSCTRAESSSKSECRKAGIMLLPLPDAICDGAAFGSL